MPNIASELASVQTEIQTDLPKQDSTRNASISSVQLSGSNSDQPNPNHSEESAGLVKTNSLPYQASHQVELLHLRAEIDALLQQLQSLKQQRLCSDSPSETQDSELHALV